MVGKSLSGLYLSREGFTFWGLRVGGLGFCSYVVWGLLWFLFFQALGGGEGFLSR